MRSLFFGGALPLEMVVFQKTSWDGFGRVSYKGAEKCFSSGNPAAMSSKRDLGQWLCAPPFRAVCPFPTVYISAGVSKNLNKNRDFFSKLIGGE